MRGDRTIEPRVTREQVEQAISLAASDGRQQKTWYVPSSLVDRVAAAAYWAVPVTLAEARASASEIDLTGIPDSASAIVESALWAEVLRLERELNQGQPFPPAPRQLRTGPGRAGIKRLQRRRSPSET